MCPPIKKRWSGRSTSARCGGRRRPPHRRPGRYRPGARAASWRTGRTSRRNRLQHFDIQPRLLDLLTACGLAHRLDSGHGFISDRAYRQYAGADGPAIEMYGTCTALGDAASKLGTGKADDIAQYPQQRHIGGHIHRPAFPIDVQYIHIGLQLAPRSVTSKAVFGTTDGHEPSLKAHLLCPERAAGCSGELFQLEFSNEFGTDDLAQAL